LPKARRTKLTGVLHFEDQHAYQRVAVPTAHEGIYQPVVDGGDEAKRDEVEQHIAHIIS
jgi:hypothetical protein